MNLDNRRITLILIVCIIGIIYTIRLFSLQAINTKLKEEASAIAEEEVQLAPPRGIIYDRKGRMLVSNQTVYDLMCIPKSVKPFDTTEFCNLVNMQVQDLRAVFAKAKKKNETRLRQVVVEQILPSEFAVINEQLYQYEGFFARAYTLRVYPQQVGALYLGDVGKISDPEFRSQDAEHYYTKLDLMGKSGIEKAYEKELRGVKGIDYQFKDNVGNRHEHKGDKEDVPAIPGTNLVCGMDAELQKYGELLMQNKRGCIVAIEPATGEILCMVSAPTYDPNLLVGRVRGHNFNVLVNDPQKPLFNRATQAQYRPGSIFKLAQSLTALSVGAITPQTRIPCNRGIIGCHGSHSNDDLEMAIVHSCNPYFRGVMQRVVEGDRDRTNRFKDARLGLNVWTEYITRFGFGTDLHTDIPAVKKGDVPDTDFYDKWYGKEQWAFSTIYSLSIGEGEMLVTPLQMANMAAILANRGWYVPPHTVKQIGLGNPPREEYTKRYGLGIDTSFFTTVVNAMEKVMQPGGTAWRSAPKGITVCGKTGTVQNAGGKEDHAVFICFAPKDNPKIAIAVYTENAGFGGTWSAPVATLLIEKYLNDSIADGSKAREKLILDANFLDR
ncbi:MAG: penicillin-binding transpeptidase domain-containing protein [Flavobacteriales bacterium]